MNAIHSMRCLILTCLIVNAAASLCHARVPALMTGNGRKILFLGDSNTYAGLYIAYLEGYLRTHYPDEEWDLVNLGLPSETVSGLSEPDHPYPRPDVHERVERALTRIKPNIVFICYGMNDGIYYPFSEERLTKYKEGTEKLVAKIEKSGAKVILMTPAPFDGTPIKKNLLAKDAVKFSWMKPYEKYDSEVLRRYSDYLLDWRKKDYLVVDAHAAVHRFLKAMRATEPKYVVSGDGIHPNPTGHAVIAFEILRTLKGPAQVDVAELDLSKGKAIRGDVKISEAKTDFISFTWRTKRRMPTDARWEKHLAEVEPFEAEFNRYVVKIAGLPKGRYEIREMNTVLGTATAAELAAGVARSFEKASLNRDAGPLGKLLQQRQQTLGLAWLSDVGYKRPGTPKGLPLAEAQERVSGMKADIRRLTQVEEIDMTVRRKE